MGLLRHVTSGRVLRTIDNMEEPSISGIGLPFLTKFIWVFNEGLAITSHHGTPLRVSAEHSNSTIIVDYFLP
jgi:hypothetical protein